MIANRGEFYKVPNCIVFGSAFVSNPKVVFCFVYLTNFLFKFRVPESQTLLVCLFVLASNVHLLNQRSRDWI